MNEVELYITINIDSGTLLHSTALHIVYHIISYTCLST